MVTSRARSARLRRNPAQGLVLTLGAGALAALTLLPTAVQARGVPESFADLAAKVKSAVVSIAVQRNVTQTQTRQFVRQFRYPFP